METKPNKYITVAYKLYTVEDGEKEMIEEATTEKPFQFISGLGTTLDAFEDKITKLQEGDKFEFTLPYDDAYGEYIDEHVLNLPKSMFEIDGRFDASMVKEGNVIPMMDNEGRRLNGTVVEVKPDIVIMDMNHPLAGADLTFVGEVVENRDATPDEIQGMLNMMTGEGCGCGCDSCDSDCGEGNDHNCGAGHCH